MGLLVVPDTHAPPAQRTAHRWRSAHWLIGLLYLLSAFAVTWRIWANPAIMQPTNGGQVVSPDMYLNAWFMRYVATAISHGHLPSLVTNAVNFPQGINAMWNTSLLLPALLLTPITLLAGPVVSMAVLITIGFAGSAAAMMYVLRGWGASTLAAAIAGAVYGFSPALLVAADDHYHLQFAVLPPLIVDAVLLLLTGRGRPWRTAIWLGLLVAAEVFIAEEMLVDTAIACVVIVFLLVACNPMLVRDALRHPAAAIDRAATAAIELTITGLVVLLLCGRAFWVQFHGPLTEHGSPWHLGKYGNKAANFVTAPNAVLFHGQYWPFLRGTGQFLVEVYAYLGWPLLTLIAIVTVAFWRDAPIRMAGLTFAILELISMGGHRVRVSRIVIPAQLMPWHWLWHVPLFGQLVPNRISILADGAAAAVFAFGLDKVRAAASKASSWRKPVVVSAMVVMLAALAPLIPRPVPAGAIDAPPPGFSTVFSDLRLRPGAPVLVLPLVAPQTMMWQAVTGAPISIAGGYCIVKAANGRATMCDTRSTLHLAELSVWWRMQRMITELPFSAGNPRFYPLTAGPPIRVLAQAFAEWRTDAVVTVAAGGTSMIGNYLAEVLGRPAVRVGDVVAWHTSAAITTLHALLRGTDKPEAHPSAMAIRRVR